MTLAKWMASDLSWCSRMRSDLHDGCLAGHICSSLCTESDDQAHWDKVMSPHIPPSHVPNTSGALLVSSAVVKFVEVIES